jgi:RNA polymerase sigma-70 factor (ECF subfamily)
LNRSEKGHYDKFSSENEIINQLRSGDIEAYKLLYFRYFNQVFCFALKFAIAVEDAEEIAQDVFVKVWDKRSDINTDKQFGSFLFKITQNMVIDRFRHYAAIHKNLESYHLSQSRQMPESNPTENLVNFYELSEILNTLIDELPTKRRITFKLSREKGYSNREIADLMKISQGTVEKQLSQALKTLKKNLRNRYQIIIDL